MKSTVVFLGIIFMFGLSGCADPCGNDILSEMRSPDGRIKFIVFQRDCGATTGFSTQVSIIPADDELLTAPTRFRSTQSGNVFVADTNHGDAPSGPGGGPVAHVEWLGPNQLRITHDKRAQVFKSENVVNGVNVEYVSR